MSILAIGRLAQGHANETEEGVVRLYDVTGYPVVELYARVNDDGVILDDDDFMGDFAKEIVDLWNKELIRQFAKLNSDREKFLAACGFKTCGICDDGVCIARGQPNDKCI